MSHKRFHGVDRVTQTSYFTTFVRMARVGRAKLTRLTAARLDRIRRTACDCLIYYGGPNVPWTRSNPAAMMGFSDGGKRGTGQNSRIVGVVQGWGLRNCPAVTRSSRVSVFHVSPQANSRLFLFSFFFVSFLFLLQCLLQATFNFSRGGERNSSTETLATNVYRFKTRTLSHTKPGLF